MTRKRFVKLLMAKGYDRNEANQIAKDGKMARTYAERYFLISFHLDFPNHMEALRETSNRVCAEIAKAAQEAIGEIARIAQVITEAIPGIVESMRRLQSANEGKTSE